MSNQNNGGPAFPASWEMNGGMVADPGMTLRDYFAAKLMVKFQWGTGSDDDHALTCYDAADAMLKARGDK